MCSAASEGKRCVLSCLLPYWEICVPIGGGKLGTVGIDYTAFDYLIYLIWFTVCHFFFFFTTDSLVPIFGTTMVVTSVNWRDDYAAGCSCEWTGCPAGGCTLAHISWVCQYLVTLWKWSLKFGLWMYWCGSSLVGMVEVTAHNNTTHDMWKLTWENVHRLLFWRPAFM